MADIHLTKIDEVWMRVDAPNDAGIIMELHNVMTFEVPGYKFMQAYKDGTWDGKIRLLNTRTRMLHIGLLEELKRVATELGYTVGGMNSITEPCCSEEDIEQWLDQQVVTSRGEEISIRDYQRSAVIEALVNKRFISLSPTSSGKSLVAYLISKWMVEHGKRVLIITPTTNLVSQMASDFEDYSSANDFDSQQITKFVTGQPKEVSTPITVSTWQALHSGTKQRKAGTLFPPQWFNQFDCIICDEAHLAAASSLKGIFEKTTEVPYKIGMTGSLKGSKCYELVLVGLFGPVRKFISTRELIDRGQISDINIKCLVLNHPPQAKKAVSKFDYFQEMEWLISNPHRNRFLSRLALGCKGNTLMLFNFIEKHGQVVFDELRRMAPDRNIYFIHGQVDAEEREAIRKLTDTETGMIICASYGTLSTGANYRNLHNVIFASPTKSRVRTLQSLGRGLRLGDDKTICNLYDVGDNLSLNKRQNLTLRHLMERITIYAENQLHYKVIDIQLQDIAN